MAIVEAIAATTSVATSASFTATGPFILYGVDFDHGESAVLQQEISTGVFRDVTNEKGPIGVTKFPNTTYYDGIGTFQIFKRATKLAASVSYEVQ